MYKKSLYRNNELLLMIGILSLLIFNISCHSHKKPANSFDITQNNTLFDKNDSTAREIIPLSGNNVVILNPRSKLYKPANVEKADHNLSLDGDAFFEISSTHDTPVIIHTGMLNLITSGSFFRVYAHQQNPGQTVKVLRGRLVAEKAYSSDFPDTERLDAGDMVMINKDIDLMEKETFDTTSLAAWWHGNMVFNHAPFNDVMRQLEDWFDVEIEIKGNNLHLDDSSYHITASYHDPGLKAVLDSLSIQKKFRYKIGKDRVEISF
ncbi:MAG: FecR family protein [Chitinophagaceae bacterium]|nr:MAG: FecR family protein [Chitinophagaceae bacterium]